MDSSLDRFIRERAVHLVGVRWGTQGMFLALMINAVVHTTVGGILTAVALSNPAKGVLPVGVVLLVAGIGCGIGSWFAARKMRSTVKTEPRLTAEGQRLIIKLASHVGWSNWQGSYWCSQSNFNWGMGKKTSSQVMHDASFELLEAAAAQYNRVSGLLQIQGAVLSPTIEKMRPSIREALDETMIAVINQVALLEGSPETASAIRQQVAHDLSILTELGDRIESIRAQQPTLTERLAGGSAILDVLEQLKMDEAARSELQGGDSELRHRG